MFDFHRIWKALCAIDEGPAAPSAQPPAVKLPAAPSNRSAVSKLPAAPPVQDTYQLQSPLFKLPAEIRVIIWKYAMSDELIHILHSPAMHCHELVSTTAEVQQLPSEERVACGKIQAQKERLSNLTSHFTATVCDKNATLPGGQVVPKGALLGLLLSCKRTQVASHQNNDAPADSTHSYDEALPFLYSANAFDFQSPRDFVCFVASLPPSRQHAIRLVHMRVDTDIGEPPARLADWKAQPPPSWDAACAALRDMQGLAGLQFSITKSPGRNQTADDAGARQVEELFQTAVGRSLQGGMGLMMFFEDQALSRVLVENRNPLQPRPDAPWKDCGVVLAL